MWRRKNVISYLQVKILWVKLNIVFPKFRTNFNSSFNSVIWLNIYITKVNCSNGLILGRNLWILYKLSRVKIQIIFIWMTWYYLDYLIFWLCLKEDILEMEQKYIFIHTASCRKQSNPSLYHIILSLFCHIGVLLLSVVNFWKRSDLKDTYLRWICLPHNGIH